MRPAGLLLILCFVLAGCVQPPDDTVSAGGNRSPVINRLTASPPQIAVGESSTIRCEATDPDNSPLTYRWWASTGDIIGEGEEVRFSASFCCAGPNFVEVTVKDNAGGSVTQRIDVFIFYP